MEKPEITLDEFAARCKSLLVELTDLIGMVSDDTAPVGLCDAIVAKHIRYYMDPEILYLL